MFWIWTQCWWAELKLIINVTLKNDLWWHQQYKRHFFSPYWVRAFDEVSLKRSIWTEQISENEVYDKYLTGLTLSHFQGIKYYCFAGNIFEMRTKCTSALGCIHHNNIWQHEQMLPFGWETSPALWSFRPDDAPAKNFSKLEASHFVVSRQELLVSIHSISCWQVFICSALK